MSERPRTLLLPPSSFYFQAVFLFTFSAWAWMCFPLFAGAQTLGPNLVPNPSVESSSGGLPVDWLKGGYGTNTRILTYPAPTAGHSGSRALQVDITSYTSGDAKWYFKHIPVEGGATYRFSNAYKSNVPSEVNVQVKHANGSVSYIVLGRPVATPVYARFSAIFDLPADAVSVTIFHVIKQVGWLVVDNYSLQKATFPGIFATGAVTLSFDDGWLSQYQNGLPKLKQAGLRGTFYIATRQLADYGFPGYMSNAQIQSAYADGMDIEAHSRTHRDLTTLSPSEQQAEIAGSRQDLLALNVGPINSFAYPFGAYNASIISMVKDAGFTNARSANGGDVTPSSNLYELERRVINKATTVSTVKGWIDNAVKNHTWLILAFHRIDTSGDATAVTPTNFNAIIDYVKQKGVPVVTINEGVQSL